MQSSTSMINLKSSHDHLIFHQSDFHLSTVYTNTHAVATDKIPTNYTVLGNINYAGYIIIITQSSGNLFQSFTAWWENTRLLLSSNLQWRKWVEAAARKGNLGHKLKLFPLRANRNVRKLNFSTRIVRIWNSLSYKVITSTSVNIFFNRIDKFWATIILSTIILMQI